MACFNVLLQGLTFCWQAARSTLKAAGVTVAASFLITTIGIIATSRENAKRFDARQTRGYVSPMLIAGPAVMLASITVMFTAPGHVRKAVDIYNR